MAKAKTEEAAKPKRKMLTGDERIAKIEAELAAAKARIHAKDRKALVVVNDQIGVLQEKQAATSAKLSDLEAEKARLELSIGDPVPAEESVNDVTDEG